MASISPRPVEQVTSLIGTPLRADVSLPAGESLAGYEIELVPGNRGPRSGAWKQPTWQVTSRQPRVAAIDGHPAFEGMATRRRRPTVRIESDQPIDAYSWRITQDGEPVASGTKVTDAIEPDGLTAEFQPSGHLRRSGRRGKPRRKDVFYPPFDSHLPDMPRTGDSRIAYTALTHAGHDDQDAYAVDFNWRTGEADRGHWVRAAADGVVSKVDRANGEVHLKHPGVEDGSKWTTVYAHLDPIRVKKGQRVKTHQRLGRIGSTYYGDVEISPHLHHQHRRDGQPVKMRMLVDGRVRPIKASRAEPRRTFVSDEPVPGWVRPRGPAPAQVAVRVRRAEDRKWSPWTELEFTLVDKDSPAVGEHDASFGSAPEGADIAVEYAGPAVEPGDYTVRYRAHLADGATTPWAYDRSITVEPALA